MRRLAAGYSGRPLAVKLGIAKATQVVLLNTPAHYAQLVGPLPPRVNARKSLAGGADFIHFFATSQRVLENKFTALKKALHQTGMLWISWPKKSSGLKTDLTDNIIRNIGLANGLVDVKVCAIDQTWSGLKFVYRLRDRNS